MSSGEYIVTVTGPDESGPTQTWRGYADNSLDALALAQLFLETPPPTT